MKLVSGRAGGQMNIQTNGRNILRKNVFKNIFPEISQDRINGARIKLQMDKGSNEQKDVCSSCFFFETQIFYS